MSKFSISHTTYQAGIIQAKAYRALRNFMADNLEEHGLTMMQWALLGVVYEHDDGIRISEIADQLNTEISLITNMVNDLEDRNLVTRRKHNLDKRVRLVQLTKPSRKLVKRVEKKLRKAMKDWLSDISKKDLLIYIKVLNSLAEKES